MGLIANVLTVDVIKDTSNFWLKFYHDSKRKLMEEIEFVEKLKEELTRLQGKVSVVHITRKTGDKLIKASRNGVEGLEVNTWTVGLCGGICNYVLGIPFVQRRGVEELTYYNSDLEKQGVLLVEEQ